MRKAKKPTGPQCVVCGTALAGKQTMFCSNPCKQKAKYARYRGRRCKACHKPILRPIPVLGGFSKLCQRKACIAKRKKERIASREK